VVVWLPDVKVLFGGDLLRSAEARSLGNTREADLGTWPASLAAVERAFPDARLLVPGHGSPGGRELLRHTSDLLASSGEARP
jgi:glyoxylase-like metal-dependent hydrolase (beta-lactamase superfamily II)